MLKDPKAMIAIAVVAVVAIAGIAVGVIAMNNNSNVKHDKIADMSWDEIVENAKTTNNGEVYVCFYMDDYCMQWFNNVIVPAAKEQYGITLSCAPDGSATTTINEYKADPNKAGTYDFIWGRSSTLASLLDVDGKGTSCLLQGNWQDKMPNMKYSDELADGTWANTYNSIFGADKYSKDNCSVAPFSGSTTTFVYNKLFNDSSIKYNQVKIIQTTYDLWYGYKTTKEKVLNLGDSGTIADGTAFTSVTDGSTITLSDFRLFKNGTKTLTPETPASARYSNAITYVYGLPHDYSELYQWLQLYPGQFYLPVVGGSASFHVELIEEAILYELAAKGSSWTKCTDKTADVWSGALNGKYKDGDDAANKATYKEYVDSQVLASATKADYKAKFPYLQAYLTDVTKYMNHTLTATKSSVTTPNKTLIGCKDGGAAKDFSDDTIMIALSTVESSATRAASYGSNVSMGMYMMDTACSNRCGLFIPANAPNPCGAIVVANLFNDPNIQAQYYSICGNAYNNDMNKLDDTQKGYFNNYLVNWRATGAPFIEPSVVANSRTIATIGYREAFLDAFDEYIVSSY